MTKHNMVRSAKARAAIVAALGKTPKQTLAEITTIPAIVELRMTDRAISALVYRLLQNGMLGKEKSKTGRMVYFSNTSVPAPAQERIVRTVPTKAEAVTVANLKVDVIKATGRIRLTLNGFTVDIGGGWLEAN